MKRFALIIILLIPLAARAEEHAYDVVVYGGTSGGVIAAASIALVLEFFRDKSGKNARSRACLPTIH